jgi:ATP-binding cassette subfamily E protein 1
MVTGPKTPRTGINEYLEGFLSEENIRIRNESISFETPLPPEKEFPVLFNYGSFSKRYRNFYLKVSPGDIREAEVLGVVGPNAIGKSTYARILAGVIPPSSGDVRLNVKISYKPQYIYADEDVKVCDLLKKITPEFGKSHYRTELLLPLQLEELLERSILELSGGELQRVAIAACLSRDASLYILDEPSAHLDVEQRILAIKAIRRHTKNKGSAALIIDHDIYLIDLLSDRLSVFSGTPGRKGIADGPFNLRDGMNLFLKSLGITFRRDRSGRPRINKPGSRKDREQKSSGEYYYPEPE